MYESFKNFELLRHQVSTRIDKSLKGYSDESKSNADNISSTIFSACFSLVTTYVSEGTNASRMNIFVQFVIAYIVAFFVYKYVAKKIRKIYYHLKRHGGSTDNQEIKELIDNFDHIACDNNLIAREFMQKYQSENELCLSTFEFYELYYYAKVSAETTLSVLDHANTCVNTLSDSSRVDLHRIYNQLSMLLIIKDFLMANCVDIKIDIQPNLRLVLIDQIHRLSKILELIQLKCDEFRDTHFSDLQIKALRDKYLHVILSAPPTNPNT